MFLRFAFCAWRHVLDREAPELLLAADWSGEYLKYLNLYAEKLDIKASGPIVLFLLL